MSGAMDNLRKIRAKPCPLFLVVRRLLMALAGVVSVKSETTNVG